MNDDCRINACTSNLKIKMPERYKFNVSAYLINYFIAVRQSVLLFLALGYIESSGHRFHPVGILRSGR